ncbi:MAG TPA: acyl-CoA thioester hydrolase/BAAT C-terminal domain-containing protein [Vicinamibacterales bacterium]|nr:acyl-CoA thioester hydrolase/BAAT C-terminal domain-containing protein [Vicinamibacterales bacterium]
MATIKVRDDGIVGNFGTPDGAGPFPGVLALGGSDGGTPDYFLNLLVPEGFACLALQYWGTSETQLTFSEIPLERVEKGLRWLARHPDVSAPAGRVGIVGASRGAELALLVAATFPDLVGPVVAYTPSGVMWQGLDFTLPPGTTRSSWTLRGAPLPYVRFPPDVPPVQSARGWSMLPVCERGLDDLEAVKQATIGIERATGPILLVSGGDDKVWACGRMSEMVVSRMGQHGRANDVGHLHYPQAGHMLFPYERPSDVMVPAFPMDLGGTPEADVAAHADAWGQIVNHLRSFSR